MILGWKQKKTINMIMHIVEQFILLMTMPDFMNMPIAMLCIHLFHIVIWLPKPKIWGNLDIG